MYETITTRNERADRYIRHVARCRRRRRILAIQWASVAAVICFFGTVAYTLNVAGVI